MPTTSKINVHIHRLPSFIDILIEGGGSVVAVIYFDEAIREVWYRADAALRELVLFGFNKLGKP